MNKRGITVYVSDNNLQCKKLLTHLDKWNISYEEKNVTRNSEYMKDLQEQGIFGTPATFIAGQDRAILGFQEKHINHALEIEGGFSDQQSHY